MGIAVHSEQSLVLVLGGQDHSVFTHLLDGVGGADDGDLTTDAEPCSDEVSQLWGIGGNFDGDHLEVEVLLLSVDGVCPCRYVLQAEGAVGLRFDFNLVVQGDHSLRDAFSVRSIQDSPGEVDSPQN